MFKRVLTICSWGVVLLWLVPSLCTSYIYPDEIGVRRSLFGGVSTSDYTQGRVLDLPFMHTFYRLPRTLRYQEFIGPAALELRTKENNVITVDVVVMYKIIDGEGHMIVEEGFFDSYDDKVQSISKGFLREHLASLSNQDVQVSEKREAVARAAIEPLNLQVRQYHVVVPEDGVVIRAITFRKEYEAKLQNKQLYGVQARLDAAKEKESIAKQKTDTVEKGIDKDVNLKEESWNQKVQKARTKFELKIAEINAEALKYDRSRRAEADAFCARERAAGDLAEAKAEALGKKLKAEALVSQAGRTYSAIEAVRNFELGSIELNSFDPKFLYRFASMGAWRQFFLSQ